MYIHRGICVYEDGSGRLLDITTGKWNFTFIKWKKLHVPRLFKTKLCHVSYHYASSSQAIKCKYISCVSIPECLLFRFWVKQILSGVNNILEARKVYCLVFPDCSTWLLLKLEFETLMLNSCWKLLLKRLYFIIM